MAYTWEEVMLNIDVRNEAEAERKEQQKILDKQTSEQTAMGLWSLGLSLVGGALFGPAGYAAGKIAGRGIGDIRNTWEADAAALDTGKFYKREGEDFKRIKKAEASDQTSGQIVQGVTDLAMMYVQAGGLQEGPTDLTTFGSGDAEWSVRGKGTATTALDPNTIIEGGEYGGTIADKFYQMGVPEPDWATAGGPSADYVPSLRSYWQGDKGVITNLQSLGNIVQGSAASGQTVKSALDKFYDISKEI